MDDFRDNVRAAVPARQATGDLLADRLIDKVQAKIIDAVKLGNGSLQWTLDEGDCPSEGEADNFLASLGMKLGSGFSFRYLWSTTLEVAWDDTVFRKEET